MKEVGIGRSAQLFFARLGKVVFWGFDFLSFLLLVDLTGEGGRCSCGCSGGVGGFEK